MKNTDKLFTIEPSATNPKVFEVLQKTENKNNRTTYVQLMLISVISRNNYNLQLTQEKELTNTEAAALGLELQNFFKNHRG